MIVSRACEEAAQYKRVYGEPIPGHVLCERVASYVHLFNLYWSLRPYGVTTLLATYCKNGPALYAIDPSGASLVRWAGSRGRGGRTPARGVTSHAICASKGTACNGKGLLGGRQVAAG